MLWIALTEVHDNATYCYLPNDPHHVVFVGHCCTNEGFPGLGQYTGTGQEGGSDKPGGGLL